MDGMHVQVDETGGYATPACIAEVDGASAVGRNTVYGVPAALREETLALGGVSQPAGSERGGGGGGGGGGAAGGAGGGAARRLLQMGGFRSTQAQRKDFANEARLRLLGDLPVLTRLIEACTA